MVLDALREKTKVIFFVVLLAFLGLVFFDWGMQGSGGQRSSKNANAIARVNGQDVPYDQYMQTRQQLAQQFEAQRGKAPETSDYDEIEEQTWAMLIRQSIVDQELKKYNITTSDPEIVEIIRNNPPEMVRQAPVFQNESGQFDPARYQQALSDPNFDWIPVENYLRMTLPATKLENFVALNARVTKPEVEARYLDDNEKVRVRFVAAVANVGATPLDEAALKAYYEANAAEFKVGETAVLDVVRFPKSSTPEDSAAVREELADVRRMVVDEGKDFGELAKTWSEDPTAERGGDLGFFARGDMVPEFDEVVFSLAAGQVSDVVTTAFGFHLIQVVEKKTEEGKEKVHARHILMRVEPSNATVRAQEKAATDFIASVKDGKNFEETAKSLGLEVEKTASFERSSFVATVPSPRIAARFAFGAKVGEVRSEPFEDERAFAVVRVASKTPAGVAPFEDVRSMVEQKAGMKKGVEDAKARLQDAVAKGGGTLTGIAAALGAPADTAAAFSRSSFVPNIGRKTAFTAAAFALPVGQISNVIETERGCYVLEVVEKIPADATQLAAQEAQLRQTILQEKRRNIVTSWLEQLVANAKIEDLRSGSAENWVPDAASFRYVKPAGA